MKRAISAIAATLVLAAPAFADQITLEFTRDDGTVTVATFDDATNMVTIEENSTPYTWDNETGVLCSSDNEGEVCITFGEREEEIAVGQTTTYESTRGHAGVAKIIAIEEQ